MVTKGNRTVKFSIRHKMMVLLRLPRLLAHSPHLSHNSFHAIDEASVNAQSSCESEIRNVMLLVITFSPKSALPWPSSSPALSANNFTVICPDGSWLADQCK